MAQTNYFACDGKLKVGGCRLATTRWGLEHLVDLERSEQMYLVICDQYSFLHSPKYDLGLYLGLY